MTLPKPCLTCGSLTSESYCQGHQPKQRDLRTGRDRSTVGRGAAWDRLSKQARALQPWCSTCGAREDLTTDHTPRAWARIALGLPVRLCDVQVLCRPCNSALGPAQPGSKRYRDWLHSVGGDAERAARSAPRGVSPSQKGVRAPGVARASVTHPEFAA